MCINTTINLRVNGETCQFTVQPSTRAKDIKSYVKDVYGVGVRQQKLILGGELLDNYRTLASCEIGKRTIIVQTPADQNLYFRNLRGLTVAVPNVQPSLRRALKDRINDRLRLFPELLSQVVFRNSKKRNASMIGRKSLVTLASSKSSGPSSSPRGALPMTVPVAALDSIDIRTFGHRTDTRPTMLIVGGVHGNETKGIRGVRLLQRYLQAAATPFALQLLCDLHVVTVPVINKIGFLAGARCCPRAATRCVQYLPSEGRVVVGEDERGGMKPPPGWADPNRGWVGSGNDTCVMAHLTKLLADFRPSATVFNHDWAIPFGVCAVRGPQPLAVAVSAVEDILNRFYPTHTALGKQWRSLRWEDGSSSSRRNATASSGGSGSSGGGGEVKEGSGRAAAAASDGEEGEEQGGENEEGEGEEEFMPNLMYDSAGFVSYTLETNFKDARGPHIHFLATLYLCCKHAGYGSSGDHDAALIEAIFAELQIFLANE